MYEALITLDGWTFLAQICNLMIQLFIFKKLLLEPVRKVIAQRKAKADSQIEDARKLRAEAEAMKKETYKDEETGEVKEWPRRTVGWGGFTIDIYAMTKEEAQALRELINSTDRSAAYDKNVMNIVSEELQPFFSGAKSAEDTARLIQDRVGIYVNEQR